MEYQIIYSGHLESPIDPEIYKTLKDKNTGGGHSVVAKPFQLKKDSNIIYLGKLDNSNFEQLLSFIKSLENTVGHLFFPNQRITDEKAISIAKHSGKKVIFAPLGTRIKFNNTREVIAFSTFKGDELVPFRCVRPNTLEVLAHGPIHEIPYYKNAGLTTVHSAVEWGYFVDPERPSEMTENTAAATASESLEPSASQTANTTPSLPRKKAKRTM